MNKYAFLCGVNKYNSGNDLRGCVNDVMDIRKRLVDKYSFNPDNIRVLTDSRATTKATLEHLDWLVSCCSPTEHDFLVYDNSSHGTQFRIRRDGIVDNYESAVVCPCDFDWDNNFISVDMIHQRLDRIPKNTTILIISDSCNSGDLVKELLPFEMEWGSKKNLSKRIIPPEDIQARSLGQELPVKRVESYVSTIDDVNVIFLSGCMSSQTSADAYIDGRYNGALTAGIKHVMDLDSADTTYNCMHKLVMDFLDKNDFDQRPFLKGKENLLDDKLFT